MKIKETYVKELRTLLEGEIEQAEVIMASKGFAKDLQDMIEKVGRLMNEDLGPVIDQMRETFGNDVSGTFGEMMGDQLQEVIDELKSAKDKIDSSVEAIATGQLPNLDTDMDVADMGGEDDIDADLGDDLDLDVDADIDLDIEDDLDSEEPELGREAKESAEDKRKVLESKIAKLEARLAKAKQ